MKPEIYTFDAVIQKVPDIDGRMWISLSMCGPRLARGG